MSFDVVGIGEHSCDEIIRVSGAVAPNSKIRIVGRQSRHGGQVSTTLATCASLGLKAAYLGAIGADVTGAAHVLNLEMRGVDNTHCIRRRGVRTRTAVIVVNEQTGDRTVLVDRDPGLDLRREEVADDVIAGARVLHVDDTDPAASLAAARVARRAGVRVTSDFDQINAATADLIAAVSVPILAESMPAALTGETDPGRALRALSRPEHQMICVTLGARGAMMLVGDRVYDSPAFAVTVVDSTGAGDVFRGAFITAMLRGDNPEQILRFSNAAAAIACTREGAIDSVPTLDQIEALL